MAKLILNKREKANEKDSMFATAAGRILCSIAHKTNATTLTLKLTGVTEGDRAVGNWKITVERVMGKRIDEKAG